MTSGNIQRRKRFPSVTNKVFEKLKYVMRREESTRKDTTRMTNRKNEFNLCHQRGFSNIEN